MPPPPQLLRAGGAMEEGLPQRSILLVYLLPLPQLALRFSTSTKSPLVMN